jgi:hypothetical protein
VTNRSRRNGAKSVYRYVGDYTNPVEFRRPLRKRHAGHRYRGNQDRTVFNVDIYSTPYTKTLHVIERYRLLDHQAAKETQDRGQKENGYRLNNDSGLTVDPNYKGKGLQVQITVEDEGVFTIPPVGYLYLLASLGRTAGICVCRKAS